MARNKKSGRLVWSSHEEDTPITDKASSTQPSGDGIIRVARQTKGRKGKGVTLISGVPLSGDDLKDLARTLKQKCGTGGTVKNGCIEIQGDHRDVLVTELKSKGWVVKKSGG